MLPEPTHSASIKVISGRSKIAMDSLLSLADVHKTSGRLVATFHEELPHLRLALSSTTAPAAAAMLEVLALSLAT